MGHPPKSKSMFRSFVPADLITLGNASCGMGAIFLCLNHASQLPNPYFGLVFLLLPLALVCDILDGYVARHSGRHSALGADLDSLADIVSFGVAPAVLGYTLGLQGLWDALILVYFVVCGISRLARFNVTIAELSGPTGKVEYYQGTPIPTSIVIVALLGILYWQGSIDSRFFLGSFHLGPWVLHLFSIIYAVSGSAMISSTLRLPKP